MQDISDQRLDETAASLSNRLNKCEKLAIKFFRIDESFWRKHAVIDAAASELWAEVAAAGSLFAALRLDLKLNFRQVSQPLIISIRNYDYNRYHSMITGVSGSRL